MNDLMTSSFLNYVELKKQAQIDVLQSGPHPEWDFSHADEQNLLCFYEEVSLISSEIDGLSTLLAGLHYLHEERKSARSVKVLQGIGDRMNSDMAAILRQAKVIKQRVESLDRSNIANRSIFPEGSPVDRARISVTSGLRSRLREAVNKFLCIRERILAEQEEDVKGRFSRATGMEASREMVEKVISESGPMQEFGEVAVVADLVMEERQEAIRRVRNSLNNLQQVMLDMAVLVEAQGEQVNDIEKNVERAGYHISGGTGRLVTTRATRKNGAEVVFVAALALFFLVIIIWKNTQS